MCQFGWLPIGNILMNIKKLGTIRDDQSFNQTTKWNESLGTCNHRVSGQYLCEYGKGSSKDYKIIHVYVHIHINKCL